MPKTPLRLDLDLGFREPRRCFLEFGDDLLILEEPSFHKLEQIRNLYGNFAPYVKSLLFYIPFELSELNDVINFATELPTNVIVDLLDLCEKIFPQDASIDPKILEIAENTNQPSYIRRELSRVHKISKSNQTIKDMNYFLEQLGVYVKAAKASGMTGRQIRTTGWIPLTQAMNPKGFEAVRNSLTPDTWFDEDEEGKKQEPQDADAEKQELIKRFEQTGKIPLSLVSSPQQYARYILEHSKVGFLEKSRTMDMDGYMQKVLYPTNRDRDEVKKRSEEAEENYVSIKSRWKGKKEERKLEGLGKAES
jgi:hypothetical protein